ncbi:MAG: 1,2-phenylacetyl-CoA epoxidase subunit B [Ignavibacteriales bacterium]|nr:1,2-phenylacetyl-CoA epoxidase subunit B [Ignavibacteriales bacterium]
MSGEIEHDQGDLWEVFIQEDDNAPHTHAGSIRAADPEMAIQNARDVFARRGKAKSMWVVKSDHIKATTPDDVAPFFDPTADKIYRHVQFYKHTLDDELWKKR